MNRRRWLAAATGAVGALAVPAWAAAAPAGAAGLVLEPPGRLSAEPLAGAALWDLDNRPARVTPGGQPLIVNFWARWCGPCRVEIPELVALAQARRGIGVVGLALENEGAAVRDFAQAYDVNYPVYLTRGGGLDLMRALGNTKGGLPYTVVLDAQGQVVASRMGVLDRAMLDAAVARALGH